MSVSIVNFSFAPASITINVGDTVRWTLDEGIHTTKAKQGPWDSKLPGGVFSLTFDQAGSYEYFCNIHKDMKGTITVNG